MTNTSTAVSATGFTDQELNVLILLERIGGSISLFAVLPIFFTYAFFAKLRTVPNTFIVFASIANIGASIASVIAYNGLWQGESSALCQAQGFMFEMFMQSDPWWSLAMAVNVLLVFQFRVSPQAFHKYWWLYCLICYGGPFAIAMGLLLVRHDPRGLVYGGAGIWCWVDKDWNAVRIYSYYMLIWICIAGSILIYSIVGYSVFRSRNQIRNFASSGRSKEWDFVDRNSPDGSRAETGYYASVTTTVQVVTTADDSPRSSSTTPRPPEKTYAKGPGSPSPNNYVTIVTSPASPTTRETDSFWRQLVRKTQVVAQKFVIQDKVKRAYLRTSFLFAISVLVTWIPSSINRISGLINPSSTPYSYNVATAAVLPLQGVWNCIIYFTTSAALLRECWSDIQERRRKKKAATAAEAAASIPHLCRCGGQRLAEDAGSARRSGPLGSSHSQATLPVGNGFLSPGHAHSSRLKNQSSSESLDFTDALTLGSEDNRRRDDRY